VRALINNVTSSFLSRPRNWLGSKKLLRDWFRHAGIRARDRSRQQTEKFVTRMRVTVQGYTYDQQSNGYIGHIGESWLAWPVTYFRYLNRRPRDTTSIRLSTTQVFLLVATKRHAG
jgi:hypothetical protein